MKTRHPLLHRLWRIAFWLFPVAVLALLARAARAVDWVQVGHAIASYSAATLVIAALLTVASYVVYCGYDLAARRYAGHDLSTRRVMLITAIAYALALNIGALIGGTGFRFRMYSRAGLGMVTISRIVAFSASTNWLGYLLLAGVLFASGTVEVPARFAKAAGWLPWLGAAMVVASIVYVFACHRLHGRIFHVRGHHFRLPSVPLALVQFALAMVNWSLMAAIIFVLLPAQADYPTVLGASLFTAVAASLLHVPGGLGVLEAVFVATFAQRIDATQVLAALLGYRALYYLGPLVLAFIAYLLLETRAPSVARA
jgi:glycosyltransferase 2 family protein